MADRTLESCKKDTGFMKSVKVIQVQAKRLKNENLVVRLVLKKKVNQGNNTIRQMRSVKEGGGV